LVTTLTYIASLTDPYRFISPSYIARITLPHIIKLRVPIEAVTLRELHISLSRVIMPDFGRDKGCIRVVKYGTLPEKGTYR
jgi:hypothetical protein